MTLKCRVCGAPNPKHIFYCYKHYCCADCGVREDLCIYGEGVLCSNCHDKRVEHRIETFDGDTELTDEVICPHCGYEASDSWEIEEGQHRCSDCNRTFEVQRNVEITYTTTRGY